MIELTQTLNGFFPAKETIKRKRKFVCITKNKKRKRRKKTRRKIYNLRKNIVIIDEFHQYTL